MTETKYTAEQIEQAAKEVQREYRAKWRAANREKIRAYQNAWRAGRAEEARAYARAWRAANKDKVKKYNETYYNKKAIAKLDAAEGGEVNA